VRVSRLYVYPVKGCRAVAVDQSTLGPLGLEHDRRFAFVDADARAVTQRDQPLLATVGATLDEGVLRLDFGGLTETAVPLDSFKASTSVDVWGTQIPARGASADPAGDYLGMRVSLVMLDADARRSFATEAGAGSRRAWLELAAPESAWIASGPMVLEARLTELACDVVLERDLRLRGHDHRPERRAAARSRCAP
jgi:uncharacterized protein YcbX